MIKEFTTQRIVDQRKWDRMTQAQQESFLNHLARRVGQAVAAEFPPEIQENVDYAGGRVTIVGTTVWVGRPETHEVTFREVSRLPPLPGGESSPHGPALAAA